MATLPIETIEILELPNPTEHHRGLIWVRGELFYSYNGQWHKLASRPPLTQTPKGYIHGDGISLLSFTFSNETLHTIARTDAFRGMAAFNSDTHGYFTGGALYSDELNDIRRISFLCEVFEYLMQTLSQKRTFACGLNSLSAGYTAGGSSLTTTEKLTFSTETTNLINTNISHATDLCDLNTPNKGYICGGTSITSLNYTTESTAVLGLVLPGSLSLASGFSGVDIGFICSGSRSDASIRSFDFWKDTYLLESVVLATPRQGSASFNTHIIGYCAGGSAGPFDYEFVSASICCFHMVDKYSHVLTQAILPESWLRASGVQSGGFL
jgi:hypothetical protein